MILRLHRLSHALWSLGLHLPAKVVAFWIRVVFGAILPPETTLPDDLVLHHGGLGIVIHPNVVIGSGAQLQHHACLATDVPRRDPRRMIIGDNVAIGAHAVVLGPVRIGDGATVGAGAIVTRDVPPGTTVVGVPARALATHPSG
jgi:serine O-acetyltransferase